MLIPPHALRQDHAAHQPDPSAVGAGGWRVGKPCHHPGSAVLAEVHLTDVVRVRGHVGQRGQRQDLQPAGEISHTLCEEVSSGAAPGKLHGSVTDAVLVETQPEGLIRPTQGRRDRGGCVENTQDGAR